MPLYWSVYRRLLVFRGLFLHVRTRSFCSGRFDGIPWRVLVSRISKGQLYAFGEIWGVPISRGRRLKKLGYLLLDVHPIVIFNRWFSLFSPTSCFNITYTGFGIIVREIAVSIGQITLAVLINAGSWYDCLVIRGEVKSIRRPFNILILSYC